MKTLTPEQVRTLLQGTQTDKHHALWALLVTTGIYTRQASRLSHVAAIRRAA